MQQSSVSFRTGIIARFIAGSCLILIAGACGDDEGGSGKRTGVVAPASTEAQAELAAMDFGSVTLEGVLSRFDVNGDGIVDRTDHIELQRCVAADTNLEGLVCDLVPDGKIDIQDVYLLSLAAGEVRPRSAEQVLAAEQALRELAGGAALVDISSATYDYDGDGASSAADILALADILGSNPNARFDLSGDGLLDLADVGLLAEQQARSEYGGPAAALDLNQDGDSNLADLYLVADVALYTTELRFGLLDMNLDGRINSSDFCLVSTTAAQPDVYGQLMPEGAAAAASAAATPTFMVCRTDGRAMPRNFTRIDTPEQMRIEPQNLFLHAVSTLPSGYAPADPSRTEGRELFIVSSERSERPLLAVTLPWGTNPKHETSSILVGGSALPPTAALLVPDGVIDLGVTALGGHARIETRAERHEYAAPVLDFSFDAPARAAAGEFFQAMSQAKTSYETLIAGCPCTLNPAARQDLVRWLVRASHCLASDLAVARARLNTASTDRSRIARLSISSSNEAALRWQFLADDIWYMEILATLMLVAETGYDFLTGGLAKAGAGALSNAAGEVIKPPTDVFGETATAVGQSATTALPSMAVEEALRTALEKIASSPLPPPGLKDFTSQLAKGVWDELNKPVNKTKLSANVIEAVIKTVIKMAPDYFVKLSQKRAMDAELRAGALGQELFDKSLEVGQLTTAVRELERAKAEIDDLRQRFLTKLQQDGCGVSITTTDPCSFDLEAALADAQTELETDLDDAEAELGTALGQTPRAESECTTGDARRRMDRATLTLTGTARQLAETARGAGPTEATEQLAEQVASATDESAAVQADLRKLCDLFSQPQITQPQMDAINAAEGARAAAHANHDAAAKAALDAYQACLLSAGESGGSCGFDADLAFADPWAAATRCVGCLPPFAMNCCGDGRLQDGEQCEETTPAFQCANGNPCVACVCEGSGTAPPDLRDLGVALGFDGTLVDAGFRPLTLLEILHSSLNVPTQPVADDQTTLNGYFPGALTLDQSQANALFQVAFPCGAGPNGFTICPLSGPPPGAGPFLVLLSSLAGSVPVTDPGNVYQYGFVFDSDGLPSGNYVPNAPYLNDFFTGTDLWFEANHSAAGSWTLKATDAATAGFPQVTTQARIILNGSSMGLIVPASELTSMEPAFRLSAFRHTGDYGLNPPYNWDGSVFPAVADGLQAFR